MLSRLGRIHRMGRGLVVCGALLAVARVAAADVIVVAADGSGSFTSINDGVVAAHDGDTVLVRPGTYGPFAVGLAKSATVIADGTGPVIVNGTISVLNGAAGTRFQFVGLTAHGTGGAGSPLHGYGFCALNCASDIRVANCTFTGGSGQDEDEGGWHVDGFTVAITGHVAGWPAVTVDHVTGSVAFDHCTMLGGNAANLETFYYGDCGCSTGLPGGAGVSTVSSKVALYDCVTTGGLGSDADRLGGVGGAGVNASASSDAMLSGSTLHGGKGGFADDYIGLVFGGDGGNGALVQVGAALRWLDNVASGGLGGGSLSGNPGAPGEPLGGAGTQTIYAGKARSLSVIAPAFTSGNTQLTATGNPGDLVLLLISTGPGWLASAKFQGQVLVQLPALPLLLGGVPAGGALQLSGAAPSIAPLLALNIHLQAIIGTGAEASLTGATLLTLIDGSLQ